MARRARWTLIGISTICVLSGCAPSLPAPELYAVSPGWADNDSEHAITIFGGNFYPQVLVTGDEHLDVDREFQAWLVQGDARYEIGVTDLQGYQQLTGLVPAGLPPGQYDLRLETPTGLVDVLSGAFLVTDTAADDLVLLPEQLSYAISEVASVTVRVETPDDALLDAAFPVRVVVEGPGDLQFYSTLLDQRTSAGVSGVVVEGVLSGGEGLLQFETEVPGTYTLRVEPGTGASRPTSEQVTLSFLPGDVADVELVLGVGEGSAVTAGELVSGTLRLRDAHGNPSTYPRPLLFQIQERCSNEQGGFETFVEVPANQSELTLPMQLFVSSDTEACREGVLDVSAVSGGLSLSTSSAAVQVEPGEASVLDVINTFGESFVAGEEPVLLLIAAGDAYGNALTDYNEALFFDDGMDGVASADCEDWSAGQVVCAVQLVRAAASVVVSVESLGGLLGAARPVQVSPGAPSWIEVDTATTTGIAGEAREVALRVTDAYDNPVTIAVSGADAPRWTLSGSAVACSLLQDQPGEQRLSCTPTLAAAALTLDVEVAGLQARSAPFPIVNGPLSRVDLWGVTDVTAGDTLSVSLSGYDAWGNPFLEVGAGSRELELYNESGEVAELQVSLGSDGTAAQAIRLTEAWDGDALHVYQGGLWLGSSGSYDVLPGDLAGFSVEPERPWVLVGASLGVTVRAVDAYGNTVTDYSAASTLSSTGGLGNAVSVPASSFWEGEAAASFPFVTPGVGDTLSVTDGTVTGSSSPLDVLRESCSVGPKAALTVDGDSQDAVLCRDGVLGTDAVAISAAGASAGSASLKAWHFYTDATGWMRSTVDTTSASWPTEGVWDARVVVVDATGCADTASVVVYVADDDGDAAGPVAVSLRDDTLSADSATDGQTVVDIAALDCVGDPASGLLRVRASLGEVSSNSATTVGASGTGLEFDLDSAGEAQILWDVGTQMYGGLTGELVVGRLDGAALGTTSATISGDAHAPVLLSMSPAGTTTTSFKTLTLTFSESIDPDTVGDATIALLDPDGKTVSVLDYSVSGDTVTLSLSAPATPSVGGYALHLDSAISDLDGNALSGDHSGSAADFDLDFGPVADTAPDVTSCSGDVSIFRPDGDDGSGKESDGVALTFSASGGASWWRLQVLDATGAVVEEGLSAGSGASSGSLDWDGRDSSGAVVENGSYTLQISARDSFWNEGSACTVGVAVDNLLP